MRISFYKVLFAVRKLSVSAETEYAATDVIKMIKYFRYNKKQYLKTPLY